MPTQQTLDTTHEAINSPSSEVAPAASKLSPVTEQRTRTPYQTQTINLGRSMVLDISNIAYAFSLPHRYHERALHDVNHTNRQPQILLSRRIGYLGSTAPVRYSLLAYLENPDRSCVKVSGAALNNFEAWSFKALIPLKDLGIGIAKILEHIAALPIHSAVPNPARAPRVHNYGEDSFCDTG